jgi:hypothetical protein
MITAAASRTVRRSTSGIGDSESLVIHQSYRNACHIGRIEERGRYDLPLALTAIRRGADPYGQALPRRSVPSLREPLVPF